MSILQLNTFNLLSSNPDSNAQINLSDAIGDTGVNHLFENDSASYVSIEIYKVETKTNVSKKLNRYE